MRAGSSPGKVMVAPIASASTQVSKSMMMQSYPKSYAASASACAAFSG